VEIRAITRDEVRAYRTTMFTVFGGNLASDPEGDDRFKELVPDGRAFGAFDGSALIGTAATYPLTLSVPGGTLAMAGLTMVSVLHTHRRRGLARALVAEHLRDARERGEAISGLWASEAPIYGRYGYGLASESDELTFSATGLSVADRGDLDALELVPDDEVMARVPEVYARFAAMRPGAIARTDPWWRRRRIADRPDLADGNSPRRFVVARRGGAATGYVVYRQKMDWDAVASGKVTIEELIALDPRAEATLWRFLASIDLFPRVRWWPAPVDTLLPWIASDRGRVVRRRAEALWLRIEDAAAALAARRYHADGSLALEVVDRGHPVTTLTLSVEDGAARCGPARGGADLRVDRTALASIYLGGFTPSQLARAGTIDVVGGDRALALADRMFAWPVAPWCPEVF